MFRWALRLRLHLDAKLIPFLKGISTTLFLIQLKALVLVSVFAFSVSYALFFIVNKITPLRVSEEKEELGLDISQHGEFL